MSSLKIQNLPTIAPIDSMKIPTGGFGDYAITLELLSNYLLDNRNFASKQYVDSGLLLKADKLTTYSKTEVNDLISSVNGELSQELQDNLLLLQNLDSELLSKADKTETYTKTEVDNLVSTKANTTDVYTKTETNNLLLNKANVSDVQASVSGTLTPTPSFDDVPNMLTTSEVGLVSEQQSQALLNRTEYLKTHNNLIDRDSSNAHPASSILDESGQTQQQINDSIVYEVGTIADLKLINPRKDKQVVFVKSLNTNFIYDSANLATPNDVTVVDPTDVGVTGAWEMEVHDVYYASWFADVGVATDQSVKLQTGHDYAVLKNRPYIIDGEFYLQANQSYFGIDNNAFIVRDNAKITFLPNAKFIQINQNKNQTNMILCMRNKNFTIIKPRVVGDRLSNTALVPTSDAQGFGYGLTLYEPENGYIFEPEISQCHGDNIYIGKPWGSNQTVLPKNITIVRPICDHARRNCISLTAWDNVKIIDPVLSYAGDSDGITGAFPKSCIDIELENATGFPEANGYNGLITNPRCSNAANGLFVYSLYDNRNFDIHIQGDLILNGIATIGAGFFYGGSDCTGLVRIDNIRFLSSSFQELVLGWHKSGSLKLYIDHVYPLATDTTFEIGSILNGTYSTSTLGNVTISNIHTVAFTPFVCDIGASYKVDGYKLLLAKDAKNGINYFTNDTADQANVSGADTYIESKDTYFHTGFSASTQKMPNEIWQTPPDEVTVVYLNTTGDYRELKIGLTHSGIVGQGCNIQGLNLLIDNVAKTQARTTTLGGWLRFRNTNGGRTQILGSYGTWTFS